MYPSSLLFTALLFAILVHQSYGVKCTGKQFWSGAGGSFYFQNTFDCPDGCCGWGNEQYCCIIVRDSTTRARSNPTYYATPWSTWTTWYYYYYSTTPWSPWSSWSSLSSYYYYSTTATLNIGAVVGGIIGGLAFLVLCGTGMAILCTHLAKKSSPTNVVQPAPFATPAAGAGYHPNVPTSAAGQPAYYPQATYPANYTQQGQPMAYQNRTYDFGGPSTIPPTSGSGQVQNPV